MKIFRKIALLLFLFASISACKKTNDSEDYEIPNEDQLVTSSEVVILHIPRTIHIRNST